LGIDISNGNSDGKRMDFKKEKKINEIMLEILIKAINKQKP
jgi:hypothetical protein